MKGLFQWALALTLLGPVLVSAADQTSSSNKSSCASNVCEAELSDLIVGVAQRTGKKIIIDPRTRAQISVAGVSTDSVDYPMLLAILNVHQFAAYESGGVVRVVPDANARQLPIPVVTEISPATLDDEWVTLLVSAKNACAAQAVPVLRPMMPQAAHLAATFQGNTLLIVDHAANARRIADAFHRIDQATSPGQKCDLDSAMKKRDKSESK